MYIAFNRPSRSVPRPRTVNGAALLSPAFDQLFEGLFNPATGARVAQPQTLAARFDVIEKDDRFEARVEIPGVTKEDIDVQIDGATVRIKAESKAEAAPAEGEKLLHSTRVTRSWSRDFTLPVEVADDRAEASYENGVLTLTLPKKEVVQPKRVTIR